MTTDESSDTGPSTKHSGAAGSPDSEQGPDAEPARGELVKVEMGLRRNTETVSLADLSLMLRGRPDDDAGSETLARYEYQTTLASFACLRLFYDDSLLEVVCEWDEDFVLVTRNGPELVSVKHLEPSQGPWTLSSLIDKGGLKHLFGRWRKYGRTAKCRLQTNGGMKTGAREASTVVEGCNGRGLDEAATLIAARVGANDLDEAKSFLQHLTIDSELPKRDDLLPKLLVESIPPLCDDLGWPKDDIASRFRAVQRVVSEAATSDIRAEERALQAGPEQEASVARALARKTITRQRLESALRGISVSTPSTMVAKLERGGLGPTDVERCKRLRADWLAEERRWDSGLPGSSPAEALRRAVQDIATEAETDTRSSGSPYASNMRTKMIELAGQSQLQFGSGSAPIDMILGAAYDETDKCHIWWSDRFSPIPMSTT